MRSPLLFAAITTAALGGAVASDLDSWWATFAVSFVAGFLASVFIVTRDRYA